MTDLPFVSVVVPVRNRSVPLARCLASLAAQTYPAAQREVIVVDNGSTEDIAAVCRAHGATYRQEPGPGSYAARNTGILNARGSVIALTDSDCLTDSEWITEAVRLLETSRADLVGGRIVYLEPDRPLNPYEMIEQIKFPLDIQERLVTETAFAATANVICRREVFATAGLFDGNLTCLGDLEWGKRVARRGFRMRYADRAIVYHPRRSTHREILLKVQRAAGARQCQKLREGRLASAIAEFVLGLPCSPRVMAFIVLCPGVHGIGTRLRFALRVLQYSAIATAERVKAFFGGANFRGD